MQAVCPPASSIIRIWLSVVELQRELYVPRWLGTCNLSHRSAQAHVRCVELDMVEGVDEVGPELQPEPLPDWEVFVQAQVDVGVVGRTKPIELR